MKISIITVALNAEHTIGDALNSVASQSHTDIEHIVIDGASTDGTMRVVNQHRAGLSHIVSEPDSGIYDAMNKGLGLARGEVIGILNADDVYQDDSVLSQVAHAHKEKNIDACYADLVYVKPDSLQTVTRYWRSRNYTPGLCFRGWMPAHPTFFIKKHVYDKVGLFNTKLKYQADLEFCARAFEIHKINSAYIPQLWVRMRLGGVTNNSLSTMWKGNWESFRALKALGLKRNAFWYFALKFGAKLPQYIQRK